MKVLVGVNTLTSIDNFVYSNHAQMYFELGKNLAKTDTAILFHPFRMSIDRMRNEACKMALQYDTDYIFFVDDDVQIPPQTFFQLKEHDKDIIAGVTYIRGYPFHPMIFKFDGERDTQYYDDYKENVENGLVECDAVGFSCCLIKTKVIRNMSTPYAITGAHHTEDIYFCQKAKQENSGLKIYVDPEIQTAHKLGSEFIADDNKKAFKKYCEEIGLADVSEVKGKRGDRDTKYLEENKLRPEDFKLGLRPS